MPDDSTSAAWDVIVAPWHLGEHLTAFPIPDGATEVVVPGSDGGSELARMNDAHRATAAGVARSDRPLLLSGDCPTARAVAAPVQHRHPDLAVVWIDAHGDVNTPAISTSGYVGGMALSMLTGRTQGLFDDDLGLRPIPDAKVVLADARDLDPAERDALDASDVRRIPADPGAVTDALTDLGSVPVHLHLDIDVINDAELSGARFPSGPGPSFGVIAACLTAIHTHAQLVAVSIACAWLPDHVGDPATRDAISRLAAALDARLDWPA